MRIQFLIGALFLLVSGLYGQNTFDANVFLASVRVAEPVVFQREKIRYLGNLPHRLRRIEQLEFRTETVDFDLSRQEYVIRASPNSMKNITTHRLYHETVQYMAEMEMEETMQAAMKERYDLLVDYIYFHEILAVKEKINMLYKDKVTLLNRSITLPNFDVLDLIEAQDESQSVVRDILDLQNEIRTNRERIERLKETSRSFEFSPEEVIEVGQIKQILNDLSSRKTTAHPALKVQSAKLYNNMLEYEWESAKSKFSVGYIQAKYGYNPDDNFKETFSIGLGFDIPLKGTANLKLNELVIKKLASENDYRQTEHELENQKFMLLQQLNNKIKKYDLVKAQLNEGAAEFVIEEYSKIAEASPVALLKLRENTLENQLLLKELEWELVQNFIDYLSLQGELIQKPLRNYLSKELTRF